MGSLVVIPPTGLPTSVTRCRGTVCRRERVVSQVWVQRSSGPTLTSAGSRLVSGEGSERVGPVAGQVARRVVRLGPRPRVEARVGMGVLAGAIGPVTETQRSVAPSTRGPFVVRRTVSSPGVVPVARRSTRPRGTLHEVPSTRCPPITHYSLVGSSNRKPL